MDGREEPSGAKEKRPIENAALLWGSILSAFAIWTNVIHRDAPDHAHTDHKTPWSVEQGT